MLSSAALLALALPAYGAVHESLAALPAGWTESSLQVGDDTKIELQVALQYQNLANLESKLYSVSSPDSADYGKYLDKGDLDALFAPSSETEDKVRSWLESSGAQDIESQAGIMSFTSTIGNANKMLDTKFAIYTNGQTTKLRTTAYSVPDGLSEHIDLVSPTTFFGNMKAHRAVPKLQPSKTERSLDERNLKRSCETHISVPISSSSSLPFTVISPECLKEYYHTGDYKADPTSGSTIAFGNFLNQSASYSDLALFEKIFDIPSQNFTVTALINGGVDNQNPLTEMDGEANLDVQNIIGLVDGLPVTAYITGGSPPFHPDLLSPNQTLNQNEPYLQYYQYLLAQPNKDLPYVITNSYGDHENTVPERYAKRVCNMIGMMGMRGRTILESSGDEGTGAVCRANNVPDLKGKPEFTPQFPGTCPYVTAVGGTQGLEDHVAWNGSSGGFSFYFKQPAYQKAMVENYLANEITPATKNYYSSNGYVDFTGRGFPDIAAHSLWPDYLTVINGTKQPNGGTSAASPVVAAIFALLNDALLRDNKPVIGFANPWLYSKGYKGLNDIVKGGAVGCSGLDLQTGVVNKAFGIIPYASWNATVGWDPVTGLGTPDFQELKAIACGSK